MNGFELDTDLLAEVEAGGPGGVRVWEPSRVAVVLGRSNSVEQEARAAICRRDGVPILRRLGGDAAPSTMMFAKLSPDARLVAWVDFDDDDIALFIEKWTQALEQAAQGESSLAELDAAEEKAEMLYAMERNPGVRLLAANPLLLTILALMKR